MIFVYLSVDVIDLIQNVDQIIQGRHPHQIWTQEGSILLQVYRQDQEVFLLQKRMKL